MEPLFAAVRDALLHRREVLVHLLRASEVTREAAQQVELAELAEIDAALARLRNGSYGRCEQCGRAIGSQRLRAVPEGRNCDACSSGYEVGMYA